MASAYIERMAKELCELVTKLDDLNSFIAIKGNTVTREQLDDLTLQSGAMNVYRMILDTRLKKAIANES